MAPSGVHSQAVTRNVINPAKCLLFRALDRGCSRLDAPPRNTLRNHQGCLSTHFGAAAGTHAATAQHGSHLLPILAALGLLLLAPHGVRVFGVQRDGADLAGQGGPGSRGEHRSGARRGDGDG